MSSRQRSRLANQALLLGFKEGNCPALESEDDDEEEEVIGSAPIRSKSAFASYSSSSESENASTEDDSGHSGTESTGATQIASSKGKLEQQIAAPDDLEYLDAIIEQNTLDEIRTTKSSSITIMGIYNSLLRIDDIRNLDATSALRRRHGEHVFVEENAQPGARRGNANNRMRGGVGRAPQGGFINRAVSNKRFVFGAPSEDWTRPPAFVAGGIGMNKAKHPSTAKRPHRQAIVGKCSDDPSEWYCFEWSAEYRFLHGQYQYIEDTGDANLLVMFLTHFPHHVQGLLQLSLVYARMAQLDKAADLVRRALYVLECASLESFKPAADKVSVVRMDPYVPENGVYFAVLYRHMQICSMQGLHAVALEVCRCLLSLHPADDAQHLLLTLDYHIIRAERWDLLLAYCGFTHQQSLSEAVATSTVFTFSFSSPYKFSLVDPSSTVSTASVLETSGSSRALQHLPNWWFSLAMSCWTAGQRGTASSAASAESSFLLRAALFQWPCMLAPLLRKIGVDTDGVAAAALNTITGLNSAWRTILSHEWFKNAENRVPADGFLQQISRVYATRAAPLWGQAQALEWLKSACTELLSELDRLPSPSHTAAPVSTGSDASFAAAETLQGLVQAQISRYLALHDAGNRHNHALICYEDATEEEFMETFPPFPPHVLQPLDPTLDDPVYLFSGAVKFRDFMDSEGRFMFPVPAPYESTVKDAGSAGDRGRARGHSGSDSASESAESGANDEDERPRRALRDVRNLLRFNPRFDAGFGFGGPDQGAAAAATRDTRASNIDFNLPLMQLFLATFLPWIFVRPLRR